MQETKCLYDQWFDGEQANLNRFTITLFTLFHYADGANKQKILAAWGSYFEGSQNI